MTEKNTVPGLDAIDLDEAVEVSRELAGHRAVSRDPGICICGHPTRTHVGLLGAQLCRPSKMECPCRAVDKVAEVQDTRHFLFKTEGDGPRHALVRGYVKTREAGKTFEWDWAKLVCRVCGTDSGLSVVAVHEDGRIAEEPTRLNGFLCAEHLAEARR